MSKFITGDMATLTDTRAALAKIAGLPRRGTVVGGPDTLPVDYAPGAAGWTDQLVGEPVDLGAGTAVLEVPAEVSKYSDSLVRVGQKMVAIPTVSDLAELPAQVQTKYAVEMTARSQMGVGVVDASVKGQAKP